MSAIPDVPEIALSAAWHEQRFTGPLRTVDGRDIEVIHRGVWSHGLGPDFRDALLLFDGRELRAGGVEVHLRTAAWNEHGHQRDPRYDEVVLHAVLRHDGSETRRRDGALVPVVELAAFLAAPLAPTRRRPPTGAASVARSAPPISPAATPPPSAPSWSASATSASPPKPPDSKRA